MDNITCILVDRYGIKAMVNFQFHLMAQIDDSI